MNVIKKIYTDGFYGILDNLHITDNAKFIFSPYKRLTRKFKDELVKVQRSSDFSSKWFGYDNNGDLETNSLLKWVGAGNDGLVEEVANQANTIYNATQSNVSSKPKIVNSGDFQDDGLYFDGTDDNMSCVEYNEINILNPPITIYTDSYLLNTSNPFAIIKGTDTSNVQYGMYFNYLLGSYIVISNNYPKVHDTIVNTRYKRLYAHDGVKVYGYMNRLYGEASRINSSYAEKTGFYIGGVTSYLQKGNLKTIIIFNTNEINQANYNGLSTI